MGIPGILKEIGKGERIALSKLAVEHLERTGRPFRIAVDAAIWQFQNQAGQGGTNPALRTLYYRLLKLLALPIHPIFVYDGKHKPLTKRNRTATAYGTCLPNEMSKKLIHAFRFPCHTAPGEAEAECALLQRKGVVDAVMSQDVDTLMFGSAMTLRDWSKEGTRGSKSATHVSVFRAEETQTKTGLDPDGMILVALLSGGDYNTDGVPGFGPSLACEIAKAQFGAELLELLKQGNRNGMKEWRKRLQYELETNESGYFKKRHKTLRIPEDFPDSTIVGYYINPAVSSGEQLDKIRSKCAETWDTEIDISALRVYVAEKFDWLYNTGAKKLIRTLAPSLLANRLRRGLKNTTVTSADSIKERRVHYSTDGLPELRLEVIPNDIVKLNLGDEEDNPASTEQLAGEDDDPALDAGEANDRDIEEAEGRSSPPSPSKRTKAPQWDPAAPQKIWIPETIAKLGIAAFIKAWEQKQRDIVADPKKFARRKCPKSKPNTKQKDTGMKPGTLDRYFTSSKPRRMCDPQNANVLELTAQPDTRGHASVEASSARRVLSNPASKSQADKLSPTTDQDFNWSPLPPIAGLDRRNDGSAGVEIPHRARYSALGLYGTEARSSDTQEPSVPNHITFGNGYYNPTTADSGKREHRAADDKKPAPCIVSKPSHRGVCQGASLANSIALSSSPPLPTSLATPPPAPRSPTPQLPHSVTQCTKQRRRRRRKPPSPVPKSKPETIPKASTYHSLVLADETREAHVPPKKAIVASRESLPGTWKEVDEENVVLVRTGTRPRRLPRVSVLDLRDG